MLLALAALGCRSEPTSPAAADAGSPVKPPKPMEVEYKRFGSNEDPFSIDYPKDWSATRIPPVVGGSGRQVEFTGPVGVVSFNVSHAPLKGSSLDDHLRDVEGTLGTTMAGTIVERRDVTVQDLNGKWLVIDSTAEPSNPSSQPYRTLAYYLQKRQRIWRLWCRADRAVFDRYRPICHRMAESLKLL
jgi:hypothetical protein